MKIAITADTKKTLYASQMEAARRIVADCRENAEPAAEAAAMAARAISGDCVKVYEAAASVMRNCRVRDAYFEGSEDLDVWIEATARTSSGFVVFGAYLTDIWAITGTKDPEFRRRCFVQEFTEKR